MLYIIGNVQTPTVIARAINHNKRDKKSDMLKHSRDRLHSHVWEYDFKLLGNNYQPNHNGAEISVIYFGQTECN